VVDCDGLAVEVRHAGQVHAAVLVDALRCILVQEEEQRLQQPCATDPALRVPTAPAPVLAPEGDAVPSTASVTRPEPSLMVPEEKATPQHVQSVEAPFSIDVIMWKVFVAMPSIRVRLLRDVVREQPELCLAPSPTAGCVLTDSILQGDAYWSGTEGCIASFAASRVSVFVDVRSLLPFN
jgi:hypothetical protein